MNLTTKQLEEIRKARERLTELHRLGTAFGILWMQAPPKEKGYK